MKKNLSYLLNNKLDELETYEREFVSVRYKCTANNVDLLSAKIYNCIQDIVNLLKENRDNF
jgi:hypothetical protein